MNSREILPALGLATLDLGVEAGSNGISAEAARESRCLSGFPDSLRPREFSLEYPDGVSNPFELEALLITSYCGKRDDAGLDDCLEARFDTCLDPRISDSEQDASAPSLSGPRALGVIMYGEASEGAVAASECANSWMDGSSGRGSESARARSFTAWSTSRTTGLSVRSEKHRASSGSLSMRLTSK